MIRWMLLCFLIVLSSLHADKKECLCGTVAGDPFYARAVFLLNLSLRNTPLHIRGDFPDVANEFFPPFETRFDTDDTYPFEGVITWRIVENCRKERSSVFSTNEESSLYPSLSSLVIPIKIVRTLKWTDNPYDATKYEHKEKQIFNFQKNYGVLPQAFFVLKADIVTKCEKNERFLDARIKDLSNKIPVYEWGGLTERLAKRETLLKRKQEVQELRDKSIVFTEQNEVEAFLACSKSLDWCIAQHQNPLAHVDRGLFYYLEGDTPEALDHLSVALEKLDVIDVGNLTETASLLKAQTELEAGLYADAVLTLSGLISQNPTNKQAYLERAVAYFELGNFNLSLKDYIASEVKPKESLGNVIDEHPFSLGLTKEILQGGAQAGIDYIPSLLSSVHGIGHGLWAFAQDPVEVSGAIVSASLACVNFIRDHTLKETLVQLVPELRELIEKWDILEHEKRGELTGIVIGKYGVDIFSGAAIVKAMRLVRNLKQANNLLTLEAMAISQRNKTIIELEALKKAHARNALLQHSNLKIQWDKQGKHIQNHVHFQTTRNRSILEHPDPQKLINDFAGKGMKIGHNSPGIPGFMELVDFGEFIGYNVEYKTGEKMATTWGKIHYAKDGTHIVPTKPRSYNGATNK